MHKPVESKWVSEIKLGKSLSVILKYKYCFPTKTSLYVFE